MAVGDEPLIRHFMLGGKGLSDRRIGAGVIGLAAIAVLIGGALAGLAWQAAGNWAGAVSAFDLYLLRIARFTLWQALLSTLLSVVPALFVARALYRQPRFFGREAILQLFAVPLSLPAIVAALGVLSLYGRAGFLSDFISGASHTRWQGIYGLAGILVAHVFFNLPLAARLFLEALSSIPADQARLAAQLGMNARASFRFLEWPALRSVLPGIAGLVFMLCATSFTIVLTLGGGPKATTLEVAIYQALRFDFDPARAVTLTVTQIALTATIVAMLARFGAGMAGDANLPVSQRRGVWRSASETAMNWLVILLSLVFVAGPMVAIVAAGFKADLTRLAVDPSVIDATATSLELSLLAAMASVALSFSLVAARRALAMRRGGRSAGLLESATDAGAGMVLVVPSIVIGAGWFILLRHFGDSFAFAPVMVVSVNAVMAMPYSVRAIRPAYDAASARHEKLCALLGIDGWSRLRLVDWPSMRRPATTAFAFAMALSLGDLGVIALFGSDSVRTLPYLLFQRMSSYRTADAAGIALFLAVLCLLLMLAARLLGRQGT